MQKKQNKMFVVRKYVMADSVASVLRKERKTKVHEVYIDDDWRKEKADKLADAIGFYHPKDSKEE